MGSGLYQDPFKTTPNQIVLNKNVTSLVKTNTTHKDKGTPQWNSYLVLNPLTCFRFQISLKAN